MTWIIALFGGLVAGVGVYGGLRPRGLLQLVDAAWQSPAGFRVAVALRLALGVVLLTAAAECRHPNAIRALGWISLAAALGLVVLGRPRMEAFIGWWLRRGDAFIRGWSAVAIAFGAFLAYTAL